MEDSILSEIIRDINLNYLINLREIVNAESPCIAYTGELTDYCISEDRQYVGFAIKCRFTAPLSEEADKSLENMIQGKMNALIAFG